MPGIEYFLNEPVYEYLQNILGALIERIDANENMLEQLEERTQSVEIINTASGGIASFPDGADDVPMESLIAYIEPVQSGSGDPAPDNIRPISGRTGVRQNVIGKNLFDKNEATSNAYIRSDGAVANTSGWSASNYIAIKGGQTYTFSGYTPSGTAAQHAFYDATKNFISSINATGNNTFVAPLDAYYVRISIRSSAPDNAQLEVGSLATGFAAYSGGHTYTLDWATEAGTVYGGTVDLVSGKLIVTDGYIASYNGESLPSTWISDRDVYAEGVTPTIGAQVVYKLAAPIEYDLTPQEITTLFGTNNIWSDTGDTDVTYVADTKLYIDSRL